MGNSSRRVAFRVVFGFVAGTLVGSTLPEVGNVVAKYLGYGAHDFNIYFLVVAVVGIMLALYSRYKNSR